MIVNEWTRWTLFATNVWQDDSSCAIVEKPMISPSHASRYTFVRRIVLEWRVCHIYVGIFIPLYKMGERCEWRLLKDSSMFTSAPASLGLSCSWKCSCGYDLYSRFLNEGAETEDLRFVEWSLRFDTIPANNGTGLSSARDAFPPNTHPVYTITRT